MEENRRRLRGEDLADPLHDALRPTLAGMVGVQDEDPRLLLGKGRGRRNGGRREQKGTDQHPRNKGENPYQGCLRQREESD